MDCCWLCGINLKGKRRRYQDPRKLQEGIRERCKPTPFVFAWLGQRALESTREPLCVPCVNWWRRLCNGTLRKNRRPYVQMDQLLLYLVSPGKHHEPDARCMQRLVEAARQPGGNCTLHAFPSPALSVLEGMPEGEWSAEAALLSWWGYNGRTEFFAHPETAKGIRCALKRQELSGTRDSSGTDGV